MYRGEFDGNLYDDSTAMLDAIAYKWMTRGGTIAPEAITESLVADLVGYEDDCIYAYGLDVVDRDGVTHMSRNQYDANRLYAAIRRFILTRPDIHQH